MIRRSIPVSVCMLTLAVLVLARPATAQSVFDDFEAAALNPFWSNVQQSQGTVEISTDVSHSGTRAVKMSSSSGGQKNLFIEHVFPQPTQGTLSVWFYDSAPGTATLYANLHAFDSTTPTNSFSVNVADWNPSFYVWHGPGIGETATTVARTLGWHEFRLETTPTGFKAVIDGVVVGSVAGSFTFDTVHLVVSGPGTGATFYWDDFAYVPVGPLCDIRLTKSTYVNGDAVTAPEFRFANSGAASIATEIKAWLDTPVTPPLSVVNSGAFGEVMLPPGLNVNLGPLSLFTVTALVPRGEYEFSCRIVNPVTGQELSTDRNVFRIE